MFKNYDVQVAHVPSYKLRSQVVRVKDPLESECHPGVIYRIPCQDCHASYIGETGNFKQHIKQQQNDVAKGHTAANALAEHGSQRLEFCDCHRHGKTAFFRNHYCSRSHLIGHLPAIYTRSLCHLLRI